MTLNKNNSELFRLIKSMNRGEKRFFSMYCNRYENAKDKTYLQLFNAIEGLENYNEDFLRKKFRNQAFVKQLHVTKNYLYNLILEALVQYNNKNDKSLHGKLMQIQILYEKSMYDVAQRLIFKVRKEAEEQNDFLAVLETLKWGKIVANTMQNIGGKEDIQKTWKQEQYFMELHEEVEEYRLLSMEAIHYQTRYRMLPKEELKEFRKMADSHLFKDTNKPRSASAKWFLFTTRGLYYLAIGENKLANDSFAVAVKIMDENPAFTERNIGSAINALGNYVITAYLLKHYEKALVGIKEIKLIADKYPSTDMKRRVFRNYFVAMAIYSDTGRINEAIQLINEMKVLVESGDITLDLQKVIFYFNCACIFLFSGDYHKSLQYTSKVLNYPGVEKGNADVYYYCRLLELINLMELKEFDLLEYRIKSFHRFSLKRNSPFKFEKELTNFIRKVLSGNFSYSQKNLIVLLAELKKSIDKVFEDPTEEHAARYFDFSGWIESKVSNISYSEVAAKRAEKEVER
jgi:hypothetical protein